MSCQKHHRDTVAEIPKHVVDAAILVDHWHRKQGIESWALLNVCSRNFADKARSLQQQLETDITRRK